MTDYADEIIVKGQRLVIAGSGVGMNQQQVSAAVAEWLANHPNSITEYDDTELRGMIRALQDQLSDLFYKPVVISSLTVNPPSAEKGSTVTSAVISYALNKTPATLRLDSETLTAASSGTKSLSGLNLTANKTWTMTATDTGSANNSTATATKSVTLSFLSKAYWGASAIPNTINSAFLLDLSGSELTNTRARNITVTAGTGKYIWYAVPSAFGECEFNVGGFDGGFAKVRTFSHTNASGYTESYDVYRSDNADLGITTVSVR